LLHVRSGDTVTWVNRDSVLHDATHEGGEWATALLARGERASLAFGKPGAFEYRCSIHPDMIAKLVVRTDSVAQGHARTDRGMQTDS
jgi:plastocyanin